MAGSREAIYPELPLELRLCEMAVTSGHGFSPRPASLSHVWVDFYAHHNPPTGSMSGYGRRKPPWLGRPAGNSVELSPAIPSPHGGGFRVGAS